MCQVCVSSEKILGSPEGRDKAFKAIERAIKAGADPEHFAPLLDGLLGTGMADRDPVAEATWERSYRRGRK